VTQVPGVTRNAINGYGMDTPILFLALVRIILFVIETRQFLGTLIVLDGDRGSNLQGEMKHSFPVAA
jgi:hypothetical protein